MDVFINVITGAPASGWPAKTLAKLVDGCDVAKTECQGRKKAFYCCLLKGPPQREDLVIRFFLNVVQQEPGSVFYDRSPSLFRSLLCLRL